MKYPATLQEWFDALLEANTANNLVKLALTKPTEQARDLKSIDIRPITVKRELKLSFTYHNKTNDIVKNYTPQESLPILAKLMADVFTSAKLFTLQNDILLVRTGRQYAITRHGPTQTAVPELAHDRQKQRPLEATKPYMQALGLTDSQGAVLKSAQDKFRQINKYIEILDALIKQLPSQTEPLRVLDMGSGKGYLTFTLYDHLTTTMGLQAEVTGIEYRPDMVQLCNSIAKEANFTNLTFKQGTIGDSDCTGANIVIALHACDTATDDAIAKAIKANASLIVTAPCCHKQVRRSMHQPASHPLHFLLQYGTYEEKLAEMVTDSLRAQILSLHNYKTNLFEFIGAEHTPKNVMITAIRNPTPLSASAKTALQTAISAAKTHFGLKSHHLESLL